jgi:predicted nucleotidyltransferase
MPIGSRLVYIAIIGGRAKGITSEDSDYDTISIFVNPFVNYLLKNMK